MLSSIRITGLCKTTTCNPQRHGILEPLAGERLQFETLLHTFYILHSKIDVNTRNIFHIGTDTWQCQKFILGHQYGFWHCLIVMAFRNSELFRF